MPGIDYQRLRQHITIRRVLDLIGFQATSRQGPQLRGTCPVPNCCSTSDRSFSVHLTRQVYHCFAAPSPIPPEAFRRGHHAGHRLSAASTKASHASGVGPDRLSGDLAARSSASRPVSHSRLPLNFRSFVLRPPHTAGLSLLRLPSCGNALDLWAAVHSLSIHQAALDLCRVTNLDPPWLTTVSRISIPRRPSQVPFRAPSRNL